MDTQPIPTIKSILAKTRAGVKLLVLRPVSGMADMVYVDVPVRDSESPWRTEMLVADLQPTEELTAWGMANGMSEETFHQATTLS